MEKDNVSGLKSLGSNKTEYTFTGPDYRILETFPNPKPELDYEIMHCTKEMTSLCPVTGQPDFAEIEILMIPDTLCVESKSLKLYLGSFRNTGAFMERIVNTILDDLVKACQPRRCRVIGEFAARGGIQTTVRAEYSL